MRDALPRSDGLLALPGSPDMSPGSAAVRRSGRSCGATKPPCSGLKSAGVSACACAGVELTAISARAIRARHGQIARQTRARAVRPLPGPMARSIDLNEIKGFIDLFPPTQNG